MAMILVFPHSFFHLVTVRPGSNQLVIHRMNDFPKATKKSAFFS